MVQLATTSDQKDTADEVMSKRARLVRSGIVYVAGSGQAGSTKASEKKDHAPKRVPLVFTIGHSTRPLEDLTQLLRENQVDTVVDIRTIPHSQHNPQFNKEVLVEKLKTVGFTYIHMPGLGGLRRPRADSPNTGWRNSTFRGFADYMQTKEFEENLQELMNLASRAQTSLLCAEAVPWRCHRSLIADELLVRGVRVEYILGLVTS